MAQRPDPDRGLFLHILATLERLDVPDMLVGAFATAAAAIPRPPMSSPWPFRGSTGQTSWDQVMSPGWDGSSSRRRRGRQHRWLTEVSCTPICPCSRESRPAAKRKRWSNPILGWGGWMLGDAPPRPDEAGLTSSRDLPLTASRSCSSYEVPLSWSKRDRAALSE